MKVLEDHLVSLICDPFCRKGRGPSLFGKAGVFACPGNHHLELETRAVTDETPLDQRLAMCASRPCRWGRKCCLAGRATGMADPTAVLRRSVRADGQLEAEEEEEEEQEEQEADSDSEWRDDASKHLKLIGLPATDSVDGVWL